jgi:tRNA-2-methylthio-N6-dimethylallyladenosine synthase
VNHWREPRDERGCGRDLDFADLLTAVAETPGVERLRFITSYPRDFSQRMVDAVGAHQNICPYLHLPVQSGSNTILKTMGRGYDIESYYQLVASLREARPGLSLSTDLIVGFPGETEEDFEATLRLVEEVRFASIYAFKYSPRPGTPALRLRSPEVVESVADERLQRLFSTQDLIQRELNEALIGATLPLVVTGFSREPGYQRGRTTCHRVVHFKTSEIPIALGGLAEVAITHAQGHSLLGRIA